MIPHVFCSGLLAGLLLVGLPLVVGADEGNQVEKNNQADRAAQPAESAQPLPGAHAHNDYYHDRPLLDALDHGFCSIEADIFLTEDNTLVVGHFWAEVKLRPGRTLQKLYLDPLKKRVQAGNGRVYPQGPSLILLVDIKTDAEKTYAQLHEVLAEYAEMLTRVREGKVTPGAVTVVISGGRPRETITQQKVRYAGIDGRLGDLGSDAPAHLIPLISDRWGSHFSWDGRGPMPEAQREKLAAIVAKAHAAGRKVRFWATPERQSLWAELLAAGVDLINTDDLPGLQKFLLGKSHAQAAQPAGNLDSN